ncbi:hypothetical protein QOZ80_7AG0559540 [Eleusine coracana subsp. coracana]|nr:hypothetical protein QOZ80_7AG0559540 [Eleusine coracana subsp. coracana]
MSMAPRRKRAGRDKQGGTDLPFSLDVLFEVLLPFPAKELCRLRTVCRSWRSLLSNKSFIAAHMKRHQNPFIIVGYNKRRYKDTCRPDNILCDIMDLSGNVVKRIRSTGEGIRNDSMVSACGDFICVANMRNNTFQLLNPATGALYTVPDKLAEEHRVHQRYISPTNIVFGQVSSTSEYKVLRVLGHINQAYQLCEVLTLGSSHPRCRAKKSPPNVPATQKNVVIDSIVYF